MRKWTGRGRRRAPRGGAVVVGHALVAGRRASSDFERAVALAPAGAQRLTWTDWAGVRRELRADLDADSSARPRSADFLARRVRRRPLADVGAAGVDARRCTRSSASPPRPSTGSCSSQSETGAVVIMRLPEGTDFDGAGGPARPTWATSAPRRGDGVWLGGIDLLPSIGTLTPELQFLAVDADQRLVRRLGHRGLPGAGDADRDRRRRRGLRPRAGGRRRGRRAATPLAAAVYDGRRSPAARWRWAAPTPPTRTRPRELVAAAGRGQPADRVRDGGRAGARRTGGDVVRERRPGAGQRRLAGGAGVGAGTRSGR